MIGIYTLAILEKFVPFRFQPVNKGNAIFTYAHAFLPTASLEDASFLWAKKLGDVNSRVTSFLNPSGWYYEDKESPAGEGVGG